jgi:hypothetical protein
VGFLGLEICGFPPFRQKQGERMGHGIDTKNQAARILEMFFIASNLMKTILV